MRSPSPIALIFALAVVVYFLVSAIREKDSHILGKTVIILVAFAPVFAFVGPIYLFGSLPPEKALPIWFCVGAIVWAALGLLGFRHFDRPAGKILIGAGVLWSAYLSFPLMGVLSWGCPEALLTTVGLCAAGYALWAWIVKQIRLARERKEALHTRIMEDIDAQHPPWE